jgi:hypothetical protein
MVPCTVVKTTIYLPDEVKTALEREAARSNISEAELVRTALIRLLGLSKRPRPRFGEFTGDPLTATEMSQALADGFGTR